MSLSTKQLEQLIENLTSQMSSQERQNILPNGIHEDKSKQYKNVSDSYLIADITSIFLALIASAICFFNSKKILLWLLPIAFVILIVFLTKKVVKYNNLFNQEQSKNTPRQQVTKALVQLSLFDRWNDYIKNTEYQMDYISAGDAILNKIANCLRIAYENNMEKEAQAIIDKHAKLAVLAKGLTELEGLNYTAKTNQIRAKYIEQLLSLLYNLEQMLTPVLEVTITDIIKAKKYYVLPDSISKDIAENLANELLK